MRNATGERIGFKTSILIGIGALCIAAQSSIAGARNANPPLDPSRTALPPASATSSAYGADQAKKEWSAPSLEQIRAQTGPQTVLEEVKIDEDGLMLQTVLSKPTSHSPCLKEVLFGSVKGQLRTLNLTELRATDLRCSVRNSPNQCKREVYHEYVNARPTSGSVGLTLSIQLVRNAECQCILESIQQGPLRAETSGNTAQVRSYAKRTDLIPAAYCPN